MPRLRGRAYIAALHAVLVEQHKQEAYRIYTTDALQLLGQTVSTWMQTGGYLSQRYADLIQPPKQNPDPNPETRTAKEIIDHMKEVFRRCAE